MKKVLIVQPVENISQKELSNDLNEAYNYFISKGFEPVSYDKSLIDDKSANKLDVKNKCLCYLSEIFYCLSIIDCVYFTDGWVLDKTCRIIRLASILYNIEILEKEEEKNN